MDISLFDYHLPKELIAQHPPAKRGQSKLLVYDRHSHLVRHTKFPSLLEYLKPGDALVVNNTKVFKARIWGERKTGGAVEVFLVRPVANSSEDDWEALVSPTRRLKAGETIFFDPKSVVHLVEYIDNGRWVVRFDSPSARKRIVRAFGHVPLPKYIYREDAPEDVRKYQTVFANSEKEGAVAAPTAGFHFTRALLDEIERSGVSILEVTLHVGPGTFKPVKCDRIEDHIVDPEMAEVTSDTARKLNSIRSKGGKIVAVGTTSVRTLESTVSPKGEFSPMAGLVNLYIKPGYRFQAVDHMVTNFHLPKSSLLILISALIGREKVMELYAEAIANQYRFYSYGDAMLIL
ncbi:MAG: tRNA preQ1(34) S-adenosylmethionine ribosyltransferase-isomerase QueA [Candidatus Zixiibacteriota bacterium]